jgi:hypothetical protein
VWNTAHILSATVLCGIVALNPSTTVLHGIATRNPGNQLFAGSNIQIL